MGIREKLAEMEQAQAPKMGIRQALSAVEPEPEVAGRPSLPEGMIPLPIEAAMTGAEMRVADNVLGLPDAVGSLGNFITQKADQLRDKALGAEPDEYRPFGQPIKDFAAEQGLTAENILANVYSGSGLFADPEEEKKRLAMLQEQFPGMFSFGEFGGDVATLAGGRGRAKSRLPAGGRSGGVFDKAIDDYITRKLPKGDAVEGFSAQTKDILDSEFFRTSMRGAGRSLETGLEAELLSMLQGNDPGEILGVAMGAQMVSSLSLSTAAGASEIPVKLFGAKDMSKLSKGAIGVGIQSWIFGNMLQVIGQTQDEAAESSYDKVLAGFALAAVFGLPGKRPKDDGVLHNFPMAADAVLTMPRVAGIKFVENLAAAPEEVKQLNTAIAEAPERFSDADLEKYGNTIRNGGEDLSEVGTALYKKYFGDQSPDTPMPLLMVPEKGQKQALKPAIFDGYLH